MLWKTVKQGSLLNFWNLRDMEEKGSVSNTIRMEKKWKTVLAAMLASVDRYLEHRALHWQLFAQDRLQPSNQPFLNLVSKEGYSHLSPSHYPSC